ncbi:MAG TPA: hypothetical protein VFV50_04805 [Bdellovibrionales bacterium]|nr:hypothetical protein [Bdellovibrionales bacterium]
MFNVSAVFLFFILISGSAGAASLSTYWVRVPSTQNSCAEEARLLSERFTQATRARVASSECRGEVAFVADGRSHKVYSLSVSYESLAPMIPHSAKFGEGYAPSTGNGRGAYATYVECLGDLGAQRQKFEEQTRLTAVAAFCAPAAVGHPVTYVLQIDGFGKPAKSLFVYRHPFMSRPDARFDDAAGRLLAAGGAVLVRQSGEQRFYYSEYFVPVRRQIAGFFPSVDACMAQQPEIHAMLESLSVHHFSGCVQGAKSTTLELIRLGHEMIGSDLGIGSPHYYSLEECMADRTRAKSAFAARNLNRPALAAICRVNDSRTGYAMELFYRL